MNIFGTMTINMDIYSPQIRSPTAFATDFIIVEKFKVDDPNPNFSMCKTPLTLLFDIYLKKFDRIYN